jgi:hypothetical protein
LRAQTLNLNLETLPTAVQVAATFEEMKLKEDLLKGIYAYGTKI